MNVHVICTCFLLIYYTFLFQMMLNDVIVCIIMFNSVRKHVQKRVTQLCNGRVLAETGVYVEDTHGLLPSVCPEAARSNQSR